MRVSEDVFWVSGMLVSVYGCLWKCLGYVRGDMGVSGDVQGCLGVSGGVGRCWRGPKGGVWQSFPLNFLQFQKVTNDILDIFQWTLRSQMSQISKCPKLRVVLGYWEALGEVSELRYKNLLYSSSKRSYCRAVDRILKSRIKSDLKSRIKSDLSDFLTGRKPLLLWSF